MSQTITFSYNLVTQNSNFPSTPFFFSCRLTYQLTPMGFIPSYASTKTQTMLEYKDSNSSLVTPYQVMSTNTLITSS